MYDFDEIIKRKGTRSMKWDDDPLIDTFDNKDVLPLWVADMDFVVAQPIRDAVQKVVDHGIFGYTVSNEPNEALVNWMSHRHNWKIDTSWITNTPGVVFALNVSVQTFTQPGDSILIQRPVYYPFSKAIENNGRNVVSSSLIESESGYAIDFEDFEKKSKNPNTTMFILCSPHNPLSKVFTADELKRMLDIAFENNLTVVCDEIHGDLIMPGIEYTSVGKLGEDYANRVITCLAPSKSFNLAGLQWSGIVIPNNLQRRKFRRILEQLGYSSLNPFSFAGVTAAYNESEEWLEEVIKYIYENYKYMKQKFESELDNVNVLNLEATYLAFVDFRGLGLSHDELENLITHKANVGLDSGNWFGPEGKGFMRFNLACPRKIIEEAVNRIITVLKEV